MFQSLLEKFTFNFDVDEFLIRGIKIIAIIISSIIIYYVVRHLLHRLFSITLKATAFRIKDPSYIQKRQRTLDTIISSIWRYAVYFIAFILILSVLGVKVQTILAGAGVLGVIFAVGSQELIKDFLDGFFNIFEDNISVGDYVEIDKVEGTIVDIRLRNIKIKSFSGEVHVVPNSKIGHLINYSLDNGRAIVDVRVDYDVNVNEVIRVIDNHLEQIKDGNRNILNKISILGVNKYDTLGYDIRLICDTVKVTHWSVQRYIRGELLKIFEENNIQVAKNQVTIKDSTIDYKGENYEN